MKNLLLLSLLFLAGCSFSVKSDVFWPEARTSKGGAFGDSRESRKNELKYSLQAQKRVDRIQAERRSKNYHGKGAGK